MSRIIVNANSCVTYRVEFCKDRANIRDLRNPASAYEFGGMKSNSGRDSNIPIDDMPEWMERRIAVLYVTAYEPPTLHIPKIGRRIDHNVYYVDYDGDDDGDNT